MTRVRVTVTELPDERQTFTEAWKSLEAHVAQEKSDWLVLPEMPFSPWVASTAHYEAERWNEAVRLHAEAEHTLLPALSAKHVFYTKPVNDGARRFNAACVFEDGRVRELHRKVYLPNEDPVWEASWYHPGEGFVPATVGATSVGVLICTEIWFFDRARAYGKAGVTALVTGRKTDGSTTEKWILAGRTAAISAGAFSVSANSRSTSAEGHSFGGVGWIIDPNGDVLAETNAETPFATREIDLSQAALAKHSYPRNVAD